MSTGSASIPLLKAAPEPEQLAERFDGGDWRGAEICLGPGHVADEAALERAIAVVREGLPAGVAVTAEAPVAWPSGAFVRVDRLDEEARAGIERSAAFAAAIGSPVLTIHLFAPMTPQEFHRGAPLDEDAVAAFLDCYARACRERGLHPLIENVPPVLRMRTGGVFLSPVGGDWRDLVEWTDRVPGLGVTLDTSHAALFRNFAACYPSLFGLSSADGLALERYVDELAPRTEVAHVSNAAGLLGEGLPYEQGELDLDPVVRRLGGQVRFIVAEINEPDHGRSPRMKAGYRALERALREPAPAPAPRPRRIPADPFSWAAVLERRDPVPSLLELEACLAGRRVLITGGCGSVGRGLATFLDGFRPELITLLDSNESALAEDRRERAPEDRARIEHVLCDLRDRDRTAVEFERAAPDVVFHLAAYKHVDWAERFPEEYVATNLEGSWHLLQAAAAARTPTVVVASTDKAAGATSIYGRTKRLMERLTALAGARGDGRRLAVRLVNVLGSAGSASDLFLRQARAGVPLTVTDPGMVRFWITRAHASTLLAHGALTPAGDTVLATAADPVTLGVGELAERIWRQAAGERKPQIDVVGARPGEVMAEVLVAPGERLAPQTHQGFAPIEAPPALEDVERLVAAVEAAASVRERRAIWLAALRARAGLPEPAH